MSALNKVLFVAALAGATAYGERVIDPFERHAQDYVIEGPEHHSEVLYASTNWYDDEGQKHDDRYGDGLMIITLASAFGSVAVSRFNEPIGITLHH